MSELSRVCIYIDDCGLVFEDKSAPTEPVAKILNVERVGVIDCPNAVDMWHDDEFLHNGSQVNVVASRLLAELQASQLDIRGDVLIAGVDGEGTTIGLTEEQRADLTGRLTRIQAWASAEALI